MVRELLGRQRFDQLIELFHAAPVTEKKNLYWPAGVALMQKGRFAEAEECLLIAQQAGVRRASIDLASLYARSGQIHRGIELAISLCEQPLEAVEEIEVKSILGRLYFQNADIAEAYRKLEEVWKQVVSRGGMEGVKPNIAAYLADIEDGLGRYDRALYYSRRGLELSDIDEPSLVMLELLYAISLAQSDQLDQAEKALDDIEGHIKLVPSRKPLFHLARGLLLTLGGKFPPAVDEFAAGAAIAREVGHADHQALLLNYCVFLCVALGDEVKANRYNDESWQIITVAHTHPRVEAHRELGAGVLLCRRNPDVALEHLERAITILQGFPREQSWAYMHMAEAHLNSGDLKLAQITLTALMSLYHRLPAGKSVSVLLGSAPTLMAYLEQVGANDPSRQLLDNYRTIFVEKDRPVYLKTFTSNPKLVVDGSTANVYEYAPLVLSYLLHNPSSSLREAGIELFYNETPEPSRCHVKARNARQSLLAAVPSLSIHTPQNGGRTEPQSAAVSGRHIRWDISEWLSLLQDNKPGWIARLGEYEAPLFAGVECDWVIELRAEFERLLVERGIEWTERLSALGKVEIAQHLAKWLVEAPLLTMESTTRAALAALEVQTISTTSKILALTTWTRRCQEFVEDSGDIPEVLMVARPLDRKDTA